MKRPRRLVALASAFVVSVSLGLLHAPLAGAAQAGEAGGQDDRTHPSWYLALGDSLAAGYQPGVGDDRKGGYVGGVLTALKTRSPRAMLVNFSCSGETSVTMVEGGVCDYAKGSQLAQAQSFLRAHQARTRLITLDIGANDVQRCFNAAGIDRACVASGLADVTRRLPLVLRTLRQAAPGSRIFVLNYYDPFLAAWVTGAAGQQLARESVALVQVLNGLIEASATRVGAKTADIAAAFDTTDFETQVQLPPPLGTVPLNVARICTLTWMCFVTDIHPNDAGYALIAGVVSALLPRDGG